MEERHVQWSTENPGADEIGMMNWDREEGGYCARDGGESIGGAGGSTDAGGRWAERFDPGGCEERYRLIAEHSELIFYDLDLRLGCFNWVGPIRELTGIAGPEWQRLGMADWELLIHPEDRCQMLQARDCAAKSRAKYRLEYRIRRSDGHCLHVRDQGSFLYDAADCCYRMIGAIQDVTGQKMAELGLKERIDSLCRHSLHLETHCDNERRVIAREIHDELGQSVTALKYHIGSLQLALAQERRTSISRQIVEMESVVDTIFGSVKDILLHLRPRVLDDHGLPAAIGWQVQEFRKLCRIRVRYLKQKDLVLKPSAYCAFVVFRILQESLTNIMRHAGATRVTVSLTRKGDNAILRIVDNGRGITDAELSSSTSFGIRGIKERALGCNGISLAIARGPRGGTVVRLAFPDGGGALSLLERET